MRQGMENTNKHIDIDLLTRFLAGEVSEAEIRLVHEWKGASEQNQKQFRELQEVWDFMDNTSVKNNIDIDGEWDYLNKKINKDQPNGRLINIRGIIRIAAAIIIGIGLLFYGWGRVNQNSIKTPLAQSQEITLPDGSHITLNAGSKLTFLRNFGKENRLVSLKGEAFFEVKKNPDKPFIIQLEGAEIKVLGTSFNVKAYKNMEKIEVTVKEGTVSLYGKNTKSKQIIATTGEKAEYFKHSEELKKQPNENRNYNSWKTHTIVFENTNLLNITETLQDVYYKKIILKDPSLGKCTVTTTFENKDFNTVLRVLESTLEIRFEEKDGKIYITGKGC
jgi:transmembrane sensor